MGYKELVRKMSPCAVHSPEPAVAALGTASFPGLHMGALGSTPACPQATVSHTAWVLSLEVHEEVDPGPRLAASASDLAHCSNKQPNSWFLFDRLTHLSKLSTQSQPEQSVAAFM